MVRKKLAWITVMIISLLVGVGCLPLPKFVGVPSPSVSLTPTPSETPTMTVTPSVVWFPPTATFTPFPTSTLIPPTPELRPGIGSVLFEDLFTDASPWMMRNEGDGKISLGKGELTLAIQSEKMYLYSLRDSPLLGSFYAEITTSVSLCQEKDEYGILVRAASTANYYRFSLSCNGQARLDRILGGTASSPQPWIDTGVVSIGAPSISRLAVWANGVEMRFFVNDEFLFSVRDPAIPEGTLGIFARNSGGHSLTVNYTNLVVYKLTP